MCCIRIMIIKIIMFIIQFDIYKIIECLNLIFIILVDLNVTFTIHNFIYSWVAE